MAASGKVYGLVKTGKKTKSKPLPLLPNAFGDEDDVEEEQQGLDARKRVARDLQRQRESASSRLKLEREYATVVEEDPTAFDYDGVYDAMKAQQSQQPLTGGKDAPQHAVAEPKARYIDSIMKAAKIRERENDRAYERKLHKEKAQEDKEFGEVSETFVTNGYKKKLMEQRKWEMTEAAEVEREARNDVRVVGMSGFYSGLLTRNLALGGDVAGATSIYTVGSKRSDTMLGHTKQEGSTTDTGASRGDIPADTNPSHSKRARSPSEQEPTATGVDRATEAEAVSERGDEEDAANVETSEADPAAELQQQHDAIAAARERFLQRKKLKTVPKT